MDSIDIRAYGPYPGSVLSNLAANAFMFDDVRIASMEGLLQSFKVRDPEKRRAICGLVGMAAKWGGRAGNAWRKTQVLHWGGIEYDRHGKDYQELLTIAYDALSDNVEFRKALLMTNDKPLIHTVGSNDPKKTILTEREFCNRLYALRSAMRER